MANGGVDSDESVTATVSAFPHLHQAVVRSRDRGPGGSMSIVALAQVFEESRAGLRLPRSEALVARGGIEPFRIIVVSQHIEHLPAVGLPDTTLQIGTGIRRTGRTSFTFGQAAFVDGQHVASAEVVVVLAGVAGPLALPEELLADLDHARLDLPCVDAPRVAPRQRAEYLRAVPLRARIGDVDQNRHVNYIAQLAWYNEAIASFAIRCSEGDPHVGVLPRTYRVQYLGEVDYPGEYDIGIIVAGYDAALVRYELVLFDGDRPLGRADATAGRGNVPDTVLDSLLLPS